MDDEERIVLGSQTAKSGFENEDLIINMFNDWKKNKIAQKLLNEMSFKTDELKEVKAEKAPGRQKSDMILKITIKDKSDKILKTNISIKKYGYTIENGKKSKFNYNQIDKRTINKAKEKWNMPDEIADELRKFTSEEGFTATDLLKEGKISKQKYDSLKDKRRVMLNEMPSEIQKRIIDFFKNNKNKIVTDVMKGEGEYAADWMLVDEVELDKNKKVKKISKITIKSIEKAIKIFSKGEVGLTRDGNLKIGKITLQRKGGTPDPTKLQFKISPGDIFQE